MKVNIEPTSKIVDIESHTAVPARIWQGLTESGKPVLFYVTRVMLAIENPTQEQAEEFERELKSVRPPVAAAQAIPMRFIL